MWDYLDFDHLFWLYVACCFLVPYAIYIVRDVVPDWLDDLRIDLAIWRKRRRDRV
jgi:hypothetical protein